MEGPKVKLVVFNCGEVPTTRSGKTQGEIYSYYCHEVPGIGRFYPYSNAKRMQPLSAMGFSNYVLYWCSIPSMKAVLLLLILGTRRRGLWFLSP